MESAEPRAPSPKYLSKTPSWILLGFVLGALFVWALPAPKPEAPAVPVPAVEPTPVKTAPVAPRLTEIEAVFAIYGKQAVWEHELTEVAMWDTAARRYTLFYEVIRSGDILYFRTIDRLTRPILTHGVKTDGPLLLTEPEEMRQEWLRERANENWKALTEPLPKPAPRPDS